MIDFLQAIYPWTKALHLISVISWMAGIFYLPRLFVHHVEKAEGKTDLHMAFTEMELKLLKVIMNPAMIATWIFGILLAVTPGSVDWSAIWPYTKLVCLLGMTWFHMWLGARRKELAAGQNTRSGKTYRLMNELPTLLMIIIVVSVVVRPF